MVTMTNILALLCMGCILLFSVMIANIIKEIVNTNKIIYKVGGIILIAGVDKWVHIDKITLINCTFKDVNFMGAVPLDRCILKNCTFENCLLTDHIRWCKFDNCTFTNCLFSGYFHGTTLKKNCTFNDVSMDYYGDDETYIGGKRGNMHKYDCNKKKKMEIYRFFYPVEMKHCESFEIGKPYYIKRGRITDILTDIYAEAKFKPIEKDGEIYYKDIVKKYSIDLAHYEPSIRIAGRFYPEIENCKIEI